MARGGGVRVNVTADTSGVSRGVKEAEGAMVPVLLERYGAAAAMPAAAAARAVRPVAQRKEFGAGSLNENK